MKVTLRPFKADAGKIKQEDFIQAYRRMFNHQENLKYLRLTGIPFTQEQLAEWISLAKACGVEYRCAVDAATGDIVGITITRAEQDRGFEIMGIVVDLGCKRHGIGRRLVTEAVNRAKKSGYLSVDVAVFADNRAMLGLLIDEGFKPVRMDYCKRYDGEDFVWLKKAL